MKKGADKLVFTDTDNGGVIHVANIKGGVGKSTVATNLAAAMAKKGPTLIIDLDVQGSASHAFGLLPSEVKNSSWNLFRTRYARSIIASGNLRRRKKIIRKVESTMVPQIVGKDDITDIILSVKEGLDLIPANSELFNNVSFLHLQNLAHNIHICRSYYKYIIIDTPSIWNPLTRMLFTHSDLNLIPVTLNALSTRSLHDYLKNVRRLAKKHPAVRIRIVKNEVFGSKNSKVMGKTRTMNENRAFLENMCEQVPVSTETGISLLPQSVIFDVEIPESAIVRNAQDEGTDVHAFKQYSVVTKAFDELGKRVQYVLNNPISLGLSRKIKTRNRIFNLSFKAAAAVIIMAFFFSNNTVSGLSSPRPVAPQQYVKSEEIFNYTFTGNESLLRVVKHAISRFTAIVPSFKDIDNYAIEVLNIHNNTRLPGEPKLYYDSRIKKGTVLTFYPPTSINADKRKHLKPVYNYFMKMVDDEFAYLTGDWCERGTGGGTPHFGIDVACDLGADIVCPISGTVVLKNSPAGGRMLAIIKDEMVLFFAHMDKRFFNTGDKIKKGTVIGTVGMTGRTSGPHAHIGYGVLAPSASGIAFGRRRYKLTDPKLFFYQEQYLSKFDG